MLKARNVKPGAVRYFSSGSGYTSRLLQGVFEALRNRTRPSDQAVLSWFGTAHRVDVPRAVNARYGYVSTYSFDFGKADSFQCDEARPACGRCLKSKRVCGGYRQARGTQVLRYDAHAVKKKQRSESSSDECCDYPPHVWSPKARIMMGNACDMLDQMPVGVVVPASEWAIRYWVEAVLHKFPQCRIVYGGILSCVQDLFSNCSRSPALHAALSAVSLGMISRKVHEDYLSAKALTSYGMALTGIQKAIESPEEAKSDETLLAILLLSLYEVSFSAAQ